MGAPVSPLLNMKFVSAYAMCVLGGTESPGVGDVKKVLESVGYEWQEEDSKKVEDFVEEMAGQNFYELIENGLEKVKSCAGRGGASGAGAASSGGDAPAAEEKKKESSSSEEM